MTVDKRPGASAGSHVVVLFDLEEDRPEQGQESTKPPRMSSTYATEKGGLRVTVVAGQPLDLDIPSVAPQDAAIAAANHTAELADRAPEAANSAESDRAEVDPAAMLEDRR